MLPKSSTINFCGLALVAFVACSSNLHTSAQESKESVSTPASTKTDASKVAPKSDSPVTTQIGADANHYGRWSDLPRPDATWAAELQKKDRKAVWNLTQAAQDEILHTRVQSATMMGSFYEFNNTLYTMGERAFLMTTSEDVAKIRLQSPYVCKYLPTYAEFFECMARQTGTSIKYDPTFFSKWIAIPPAMPLPYTIELAKDWTAEDRHSYVANFPKIQPVGMDVYMFGRYSGLSVEKAREVRDTIALNFATHIDPSAKLESMKEVKVDGSDAIYYETTPPKRPDGKWRQWSFIKNGQAFLIVSALADSNSKILLPQVQSMVSSFHVKEPAPASPGL